MSDLYSGLINPRLRKGQNGEKFWGAFDSLDNTKQPDASEYLKLQINGLQILEASSSQKYQVANQFLKQAQQKMSNATSIEEAIYNQAEQKILELLNAGLKGSQANPYKQAVSKTQEGVQGEIAKVIRELIEALDTIKVSPQLTQQMVSLLNQRLQTFDWQSPTPHTYIQEKADAFEQLMAERLNQYTGLKSIVTGGWTDQLSGKQLIEDVFAFSEEDMTIPFENGVLTYSIKTSEGIADKSAGSIFDFLNQLESVNGTVLSVQLSNELYEALQKGAALTGQAKSGLAGQNILTNAKRNALSLEEVEFDPMLLWELYQADLESRTEYFKPQTQQDSATLEAITNYCLSKNIAKTALARNQVYLTADGFVTASQWMQQYQRYLIFTPGIRSVSGDFLTRSRPYYFNA